MPEETEGNVTVEETPSAEVETTQEQPTSPDWEAVLEERLQSRWNEHERALVDRFNQELAKRDQSRDDQLLNRIQKRLGPKLELYEQVAKEEGWDDKKLEQKKQTALAQEFQSAIKEVPTKPVQPPSDGKVGIQALRQYVKEKGLDPSTFDYYLPDGTAFADLTANDARGVEFISRVEQAVKSKTPAKPAKEGKKVEAGKEVAEVKGKFGGTATPTSTPGGSSSADSLEERFNQLANLKSVPQSQRAAIHREMDEIEQKLKQMGRWT